ncbi:unnamed protein product [Polarella glacialis]|uniref:3-hydroxyisobutyryl-CoA hydrolase n=1 Tax=Polarella glacialis TaxID=89957 RepID=A0A813JTT5_POLGL|nr:unnamed protein product [Polarella glacialis]CAE8688676.1 unnamed protein product [Polarella glacialis]
MGGGVGLSIHGPIRIATEKTLFAMPETGIGLFPDVGATWALSRLKAGAHVGMLLGLTGQRLGAADCVYAGLATHFCPSERLPDVEASLRALGDRASDAAAVASAISEVAGASQPDLSKASLEANAAAIERCFGACSSSAEEIVLRLEAESSEWSANTLKVLRSKSPLSIKVSLEALRRHQAVSLKEAIIAEYRMSQWFMRPAPSSDFCEGIRAVLVDKDNAPRWQLARLEDVSKDQVEEFFAALGPAHPRGELQL